MNSQQLRKVLMTDEFTSVMNPSVQSLDEFLTTDLLFPSMRIINYDYSYQRGSHWVALNMSSTATAEYFDSYGGVIKHPQIERKLKDMQITRRNAEVLQGFSTVCGQYCLVFLLLRARDYSFQDIISKLLYVDSTAERDIVVNQLINKLYFPTLLQNKTVVFDERMIQHY